MSELSSKTRDYLPTKDFGLPKQRKYPMEDKTHARDAKSRASAAYEEGHLSKASEERIDRKADRKLHGENISYKMLKTLHKEGIKEHEQSHWG